MAFASGAVTFKRFFVQGNVPQQVDEPLLEQLASRAIGADSIRTADHTEIGWTTGEHVLDTQFDFAKNAVADGAHFGLRIDTNKPSTELVRSYQKMNEQTMLEASGREFLSKAQRREAREQALSRADAEARSGAFRRMKQVPVFWDLKRNELYLGTTSTAVADQLILLFRETFDLALVPASSGELAMRWSALAGETRAFDDCKPAFFINPPEGADLEGDPAAFTEGRSKDFLGTEWLTWLWYASHVQSPEIVTRLGHAVTVLFEKSLQLECAFKLTGSVAITTDAPSRSTEATVALAGGKRPIRVGLQVASNGQAFSLAVRGDVMHLSSVVLPPPEGANSPRVVFEERIDHLRDLIEAIDSLYHVFLHRRLSSKWAQTLNSIRSWVASGRPNSSALTEAAANPAGAAS